MMKSLCFTLKKNLQQTEFDDCHNTHIIVNIIIIFNSGERLNDNARPTFFIKMLCVLQKYVWRAKQQQQ